MSQTGDELIVTMADIQKAGYCARGAKTFFKDRDLDFRAFLRDGIEAQILLETGDARAIKTVEAKIEREWIASDLEGVVITIDDLKASKKCNAGARQLAARQGIEWSSFVDGGISAEKLLATGDRDALRVIKDKLERSRG